MRVERDGLGGVASILLGLSYLSVGASFLLMPAVLRSNMDYASRLAAHGSLAHGSQKAFFASYVVGCVLAFAAVPAIVQRVAGSRCPVVEWTTRLSYLGFAVLAITALRWLAMEPTLASLYAGAEPGAQVGIVAAMSTIPLDPHGWLIFGSVGVWLLALSIRGLRDGSIPRSLGVLGICGALTYLLIPIGNEWGVPGLVVWAAGMGGGCLAPVWYGWMGVRLLGGEARSVALNPTAGTRRQGGSTALARESR
jgi:hypothetical protein